MWTGNKTNIFNDSCWVVPSENKNSCWVAPSENKNRVFDLGKKDFLIVVWGCKHFFSCTADLFVLVQRFA